MTLYLCKAKFKPYLFGMGMVIIFCATVLLLLRGFIAYYPPTASIKNAIQSHAPYPTTVEKVAVSWRAVSPIIELSHVDIVSEEGAQYHCDKVQARVALLPLLFKQVHFKKILIEGAELKIVETRPKVFEVAGMPKLSWRITDSGKSIANSGFVVRFCEVSRCALTLKRYNGDLISTEVTKAEGDWHASLLGNIKSQFHIRLDKTSYQPVNEAPIVFGTIQGLFQIQKTAYKWDIKGTQCSLGAESADAQKHDWDFEAQYDLQNLEGQLTTNYFDVVAWPAFLAKCHVLEQQVLDKLNKADIKSDVSYFNLVFHSVEGAWRVKLLDLVFENARYGTADMPFSVSQLNGAFSYNGTDSQLRIKSNQATVALPRFFDRPIPLNDATLDLQIQKTQNDWVIVGSGLKFQVEQTPLVGSFKCILPEGHALPEINLIMDMGSMPVNDALTLLPNRWLPPMVTQWLEVGLLSGNINATTLMLQGDLQKFPFNDQDGLLEVACELSGVKLHYHPKWPDLENISGVLRFKNRTLKLDGHIAQIQGAEVHDIEALIPDLINKAPVLTVDTKIISNLQQAKSILMDTPLASGLGAALQPFPMTGPIELSLGLEIPLTKRDDADIKVRGLLGLKDTDIILPGWDLGIDKLAGEIQFSDHHLYGQHLKGNMLGGESTFGVTADLKAPDAFIRIGCQGDLQESQFIEWRKLPDIPFMQGQTTYQASLDFSPHHKHPYHFSFLSNLRGIEVEAPPPLNKTLFEIKPLKLDIYVEEDDRVRSFAQYGDKLSMALSMKQGEPNELLGGHINIGEKQIAKFREDGIFLLDGELDEFNFDAWEHFYNICQVLIDKKASSALTVEPLLALESNTMFLQGLPIKHAKLEAEWQNDLKLWNIHLDGSGISGMIFYPPDKEKDLQIRLQKLILSKEDIEKLSTLSSKSNMPLEQPIDLTLVEGNINNIPLSQVSLKMHAGEKGTIFDQISLSIPGADLNMTGQWNRFDDKSQVEMKGKLKLKNTTDMLRALDKPSSIRQAKGLVDFNLNWFGQPYKLDFPTLEGSVDLRLEKGAIRGKNPGIGRILNLVNLDNLFKRLTLDFSDVTHKQFAFNELTGHFVLGKGTISSNDVILNSPAAKILGYGQADLLTQGLHGEMIVMPNLTATLPMASGATAAVLAISNPLIGLPIGAGAWVVDKMIGNKIQGLNRFRYRLAGTWQSPQVDEITYSLNPTALME